MAWRDLAPAKNRWKFIPNGLEDDGIVDTWRSVAEMKGC